MEISIFSFRFCSKSLDYHIFSFHLHYTQLKKHTHTTMTDRTFYTQYNLRKPINLHASQVQYRLNNLHSTGPKMYTAQLLIPCTHHNSTSTTIILTTFKSISTHKHLNICHHCDVCKFYVVLCVNMGIASCTVCMELYVVMCKLIPHGTSCAV